MPSTWVELVEPPRNFARQLHVWHLIFTDRNVVRLVQQDVGRLQQGISEKTIRPEVLVLEVLALLLVAGHTLQPSQRSDHAEQQVQLGVLQNVRLDEQRAALGIEQIG